MREEEGLLFGNIGRLLARQNQPETAIVFYKQSVNVRESIREDIRQLPRDSQEAYAQSVAGTYRALADLLLSQGRVLEAQQVLELLKIQELRDFSRDTRAGGDTNGSPLTPREAPIPPAFSDKIAIGQKLTVCESQTPRCPERESLQAQLKVANNTFNQLADRLRTQQTTKDPAQLLRDELNGIIRTQPSDRGGIFPGSKFLNQTFDRRAFNNLIDYRILHIATHGKFVPGQPEDSFLVLGNGDLLRIPEIKSMTDLNAIHLVVLSACETAKGGEDKEGLEVSGISYYFITSGAKAVIASLWLVNDASTSLLMQQFYQNLPKGMSKTQALRQMQLQFIQGKLTPIDASKRADVEVRVDSTVQAKRQSANFSHPYYWAPFILIGNGL